MPRANHTLWAHPTDTDGSQELRPAPVSSRQPPGVWDVADARNGLGQGRGSSDSARGPQTPQPGTRWPSVLDGDSKSSVIWFSRLPLKRSQGWVKSP